MKTGSHPFGIGQVSDDQLVKLISGSGAVLIIGGVGSGKTLLANTLLGKALEMGRPAIALDCLDWDEEDALTEAASSIGRQTVALATVDHVRAPGYPALLAALKQVKGGPGCLVVTAPFIFTPAQEQELIEHSSTVVFMDPFGRAPRFGDGMFSHIMRGTATAFAGFTTIRRSQFHMGTGWMLAMSEDGFFYGRAPAAA